MVRKQTTAISSPWGLAALSTTPTPSFPENPRQAPVSQEEHELWNPKT